MSKWTGATSTTIRSAQSGFGSRRSYRAAAASASSVLKNLTSLAGQPTASPRKHRQPPQPPSSPSNSKHVHLFGARVNLCPNPKNCGECMKKDRRRLRRVSDREEGVEYTNMTRKGCPHPNCGGHPIGKDCWPDFRHNN